VLLLKGIAGWLAEVIIMNFLVWRFGRSSGSSSLVSNFMASSYFYFSTRPAQTPNNQ
jgi:hypothetical protein